MKKVISLLLVFSVVFAFASCSKDGSSYDSDFYEDYPTGDIVETIEIKKNPVATITLEDGSEIVMELYYYSAPNTVASFIAFAEEGVYDGMAFNMVRNKCIVMTGAAEGEFSAPYYIMDEYIEGEENQVSHTYGAVSMARTSHSDTVTGQFFVLTKDQKHFDGNYNAFGYITEGMDIVEKIAASELDADNKLFNPYVIKSVKVDTFGKKFPKPNIIKKDS